MAFVIQNVFRAIGRRGKSYLPIGLQIVFCAALLTFAMNFAHSMCTAKQILQPNVMQVQWNALRLSRPPITYLWLQELDSALPNSSLIWSGYPIRTYFLFPADGLEGEYLQPIYVFYTSALPPGTAYISPQTDELLKTPGAQLVAEQNFRPEAVPVKELYSLALRENQLAADWPPLDLAQFGLPSPETETAVPLHVLAIPMPQDKDVLLNAYSSLQIHADSFEHALNDGLTVIQYLYDKSEGRVDYQLSSDYMRHLDNLNKAGVYLQILLAASLSALALIVCGVYGFFKLTLLERAKAFAVCRAIGARAGRLYAEVFFEFFFVFAVSSALGVLTGENLTLLAGEFTEEVPLLLSPWAVPAVAALAALLSAGATLYARRTMAKGEIAALLHNE